MKKTTVDKSSEQESYVAKYLDAWRTPRSGGGLSRKGDVYDEYSLFECKTYMERRESFTVKKEWLEKLDRERSEDRKALGILVINFGGNGNEDNHVVMKLEDFEALYNDYKHRREPSEE